MAFVLPIIGLTGLLGSYLTKNNTERRNLSIRNDIIENDKPNGSNIYSSNMVNEAEQLVLQKATDNYNASNNPSITNVLPPLFNTYSVSGNKDIMIDSYDMNKINELNRRNNILETTQAPPITSRPMFNPVLFVSNDDNKDNKFSDFTNENSEINQLTGLPYDKAHNNQVPFFGGTLKQNVEKLTNVTKLDMFTGSSDTFVHKKETVPFYPLVKQDINGTPMITVNTDMSRFIQSKFKQDERPFEQARVSAIKSGTIENPIRSYGKSVDELRVASKPKMTYEGRTISGQYMNVRGVQPKLNKNKVDTYYENTSDRWNKTTGAIVNESARQNFETNFKETNRQDTSNESYYGPGQSMYNKDSQRMSLIPGGFDSEVKEPIRQTLKIDTVRNFNTNNRKDDEYDGKSSYRVYDTERHITGETNKFDVNVNMQNKGNRIYLQDDAKGTIKETTSENKNKGYIKTTFDKGSIGAFDKGLQNWDAKVTNKEIYVNNKYIGIADKNEGMGYSIANYQAKTTGKETIHSSYYGNNSNSGVKTTMSRFNYNQAEINDKKEILVSNNRSSGPNKYQISSGMDNQGAQKYTENMKLKENQSYRRSQDVNEFLNPLLPKIISQSNQLGVIENKKHSNESDRLQPSFVLNQLKNNPLVINGPNRI